MQLDKSDIARDARFELVAPVLLIRRDHDGETWLTLPAIEEHGVGPSLASAKRNLWQNLCNYLESLEENRENLSEALKRDLTYLGGLIQRRHGSDNRWAQAEEEIRR